MMRRCKNMRWRCSKHAYVNQAISALKFYFRHVLKQPKSAAYVRPKKESKLPDVLSLNEVMRLLKAVKNPKHKAILYLTYTSGLRVSEVVRYIIDREEVKLISSSLLKQYIKLLTDRVMVLEKIHCIEF